MFNRSKSDLSLFLCPTWACMLLTMALPSNRALRIVISLEGNVHSSMLPVHDCPKALGVVVGDDNHQVKVLAFTLPPISEVQG